MPAFPRKDADKEEQKRDADSEGAALLNALKGAKPTSIKAEAASSASKPDAFAEWEESKHDRDRGKFAPKGGNSAHPSVSPSPRADAHTQSLLARLAEVPAALRDKATTFIANKYAKLSERYGATGAKAVLAAMVLLTPVPLPGTSLLPIALAEGVRKLSGMLGGARGEKTMADGVAAAAGVDAGEGAGASLEALASQAGMTVGELESAAREALEEAQGLES